MKISRKKSEKGWKKGENRFYPEKIDKNDKSCVMKKLPDSPWFQSDSPWFHGNSLSEIRAILGDSRRNQGEFTGGIIPSCKCSFHSLLDCFLGRYAPPKCFMSASRPNRKKLDARKLLYFGGGVDGEQRRDSLEISFFATGLEWRVRYIPVEN